MSFYWTFSITDKLELLTYPCEIENVNLKCDPQNSVTVFRNFKSEFRQFSYQLPEFTQILQGLL